MAPAATPSLVLEFALDPDAAARLARHPAMAGARAGRRGRPSPEELIWYDTPDGALAARGLAMEALRRGTRRLLKPSDAAAVPWMPGTPLTVQADGPDGSLPELAGLAPVAAFSGRRTVTMLGNEAAPLRAELSVGKLRAVADERPVARLLLSGEPEAVLGLARRLAADLPLLPASAPLPTEGRALARGEPPPPRRRGAPDLGAARDVETALLIAHGHLLEVLLHYAPRCRAGAGPEGVHQMRVALRRLRSVLRAFRPAATCDAVGVFDDALKQLAGRLGAARDLDVFLLGLGAELREAMPEERRLTQLLRAVEARRAAAYVALRTVLDGPGFRALMLDGLTLMVERPWRDAAAAAPDQATTLAEPLPSFAARLLDKRWNRLISDGADIRAFDAAALHELRLTAKRLRYAAELFLPLWPGKLARRFIKRLGAVQEELGRANDAAVARATVASLGPSVPAWAVGVAEGFALARSSGARRSSLAAWEDLTVAKVFWSD